MAPRRGGGIIGGVDGQTPHTGDSAVQFFDLKTGRVGRAPLNGTLPEGYTTVSPETREKIAANPELYGDIQSMIDRGLDPWGNLRPADSTMTAPGVMSTPDELRESWGQDPYAVGNAYKDFLGNKIDSIQGWSTPQLGDAAHAETAPVGYVTVGATYLDRNMSEDAVTDQTKLYNLLKQQENGLPLALDQQLAQGTIAARNAQTSAAASMGAPSAAMTRQLAWGRAGLQQQQAAARQQLDTQLRLDAQDQLAQLAGTMRDQDIRTTAAEAELLRNQLEANARFFNESNRATYGYGIDNAIGNMNADLTFEKERMGLDSSTRDIKLGTSLDLLGRGANVDNAFGDMSNAYREGKTQGGITMAGVKTGQTIDKNASDSAEALAIGRSLGKMGETAGNALYGWYQSGQTNGQDTGGQPGSTGQPPSTSKVKDKNTYWWEN